LVCNIYRRIRGGEVPLISGIKNISLKKEIMKLSVKIAPITDARPVTIPTKKLPIITACA